jgi:hypothetical protein
MTDTTKDAFDAATTLYPNLKDAECWAVVGRGRLVFRYGPFAAPEVGQIMTLAMERGIEVTIIANCGKPFDWDLAKDLKGWTEAEYRADERRACAEALEKMGHKESADLLRGAERFEP